MKSVEARIEKLEKQIAGPKGGKLYNYAGDLVADARIVKTPTKHGRGLAVLPDGSKQEIAPTANLLDIILTAREQWEQGQVTSEPVIVYDKLYRSGPAVRSLPKQDYHDVLFLRVPDRPGMIERLVHLERWEGVV